MPKKLILALCAILIGLSIYSCSELILPKQVGIKGTLGLPIRVGAANLNEILKKEIEKAFPANENEDKQESIKVYNVDYKGQTVQTFYIYLPIKMTEDLNPNSFLKKIDEQINTDMEQNAAPIPFPPGGVAGMPITGINLVNIPPLSLTNIAQYVKTIDFKECNKNDESAGIGLNFYFEEIPKGLTMTIECEELHISTTKSLEQGNNIFGNNDGFSLDLEKFKYKDEYGKNKELIFKMTLQSDDGTNNWNPVGLNPGTPFKITGKMRFFRVWTEAKIDLAAAINTFSKIDELTGKFPATAFDLSRLGYYFDGEFSFKDLKVKIYMDGPNPDLINRLNAKLTLEAQYTSEDNDGPKILYDRALLINSQPINLDDYLNDGSYKYPYLPGNTSENNIVIDEDIIKDIFKTMPNDLFFIFRIDVVGKDEDGNDRPLVIKREDVENTDNSGVITTTMMIMLPISLTAERDNDNKSKLLMPDDMFGNGDLFGRKNGNLFSAGDIDYIKMTIDFPNQIFSNGHLFINEKKELFPEGIKLNGKKTVAYVSHEQLQTYPIIPNIRIEIDKGETINVPKNIGIVNIKLEMKGLVRPGEL